MTIPSSLLLGAAAALRANDRPPDPTVRRFLMAIDYERTEPGGSDRFCSDGLRQHRIALLSLASKLTRIFQLHAPDAPGLAFFGGELSRQLASNMHPLAPSVSVSGKGTSLQEAFESCIGEAAEYLSQLEIEDDTFEHTDPKRAFALLDERSRRFVENVIGEMGTTSSEIDWIQFSRLTDGTHVLLPADLCLRRADICQSLSAPFLLGTGTAAGPSLEAATLHALLELIERDALGLWWKGGRRGRAIDVDCDCRQSLFEFLYRLRNGRKDRETWLLDITSDVGVPCAVAISCHSGGEGFAFGAAARLSMLGALRSALLEMCQMELAYAVVAAKRCEGGDDALNERDLEHLRRANSINAVTCELLQPLPAAEHDPAALQSLAAVVSRLADLGIAIFARNITRSTWGIPAVRLLAPALQLEPSNLVSERLHMAISETGGGHKFTRGAPLL